VQLRVLGAVEVLVGDVAVPLRSTSVRTVLAALLMEPNTLISVDDLVEHVWGMAAPPSAVNQVQIAISQLRRVFGRAGIDATALLATRAPGYALRLAEFNDQIRFDLAVFRRHMQAAEKFHGAEDWAGARTHLDQALQLWRGPAFQDVASARVGAFAQRLEQERQSAIERLRATELLQGRYAEAATALSDLDGFQRERLWYLRILAHALEGRQQQALSDYRNARRRLIDDLGLEPGAELRDLERLILTGSPEDALKVIRSWIVTAPFEPVVPQQLPADLPYLIGRTDELALLDRLLASSPQQPALVCISGIGGMGKSTLAVRAARMAAHRFPDGCLFADLRAGQTDPADPHDLIGQFLRAQGVPGAAVPVDVQERIGLYRTVLADRKVLILLDNVASEDQVRPLVPPAGSAVLVTSRRPLAGLDAVHHIDLQVLGRQAAIQLLAQLAGTDRIAGEPQLAARLDELCGHLPLAIRIVGVRLARRRDLTLAQLVTDLTDERFRLDELSVGDQSVRASLALTWQDLPADAAQLLVRLSLLPLAQFPAVAAESLGGSPRETRHLIGRLVEANLLTALPAHPTRYQLHDLVRLHAREQQQPAHDADAALRRAYATLLHVVQVADAGLPAQRFPTPPLADFNPSHLPQPDPISWLESEKGLIFAAIRDAHRRGWHEEAWQLLVSMTNFSGLRGWYDEWLGLLHLMMADLSSLEPEGRAALLLAKAGLAEGGDIPGSLSAARRARLLYRRHGDRVRAACSAMQLATLLRSLHRERPARAAYLWAIARLSDQECPGQLGWAHLGLGNLELQANAPSHAREDYERALTLMRKAADRMGEANALGCLGTALRRLGQTTAAIEHLRQSLDIHAEIGDPTGQGMVQSVLAEVYLDQGQWAEATYWNDTAMHTFQAISSLPGQGRSMTIRSKLLQQQNRIGAAIDAQERANGHWQSLGAHADLAHGMRRLDELRVVRAGTAQ